MTSPLARLMGALREREIEGFRKGDRVEVTLPAWDLGLDLPAMSADPFRDRLELGFCERGRLETRMIYGSPAQLAFHAAITALILIAAITDASIAWKDAFLLALLANSVPFAISWLNAERLRRQLNSTLKSKRAPSA